MSLMHVLEEGFKCRNHGVMGLVANNLPRSYVLLAQGVGDRQLLHLVAECADLKGPEGVEEAVNDKRLISPNELPLHANPAEWDGQPLLLHALQTGGDGWHLLTKAEKLMPVGDGSRQPTGRAALRRARRRLDESLEKAGRGEQLPPPMPLPLSPCSIRGCTKTFSAASAGEKRVQTLLHMAEEHYLHLKLRLEVFLGIKKHPWATRMEQTYGLDAVPESWVEEPALTFPPRQVGGRNLSWGEFLAGLGEAGKGVKDILTTVFRTMEDVRFRPADVTSYADPRSFGGMGVIEAAKGMWPELLVSPEEVREIRCPAPSSCSGEGFGTEVGEADNLTEASTAVLLHLSLCHAPLLKLRVELALYLAGRRWELKRSGSPPVDALLPLTPPPLPTLEPEEMVGSPALQPLNQAEEEMEEKEASKEWGSSSEQGERSPSPPQNQLGLPGVDMDFLSISMEEVMDEMSGSPAATARASSESGEEGSGPRRKRKKVRCRLISPSPSSSPQLALDEPDTPPSQSPAARARPSRRRLAISSDESD